MAREDLLAEIADIKAKNDRMAAQLCAQDVVIEQLEEGQQNFNDWVQEAGLLRERLTRVEEVLTDEWGMAMPVGSTIPDDDDFAEAIGESGAWRLARDLRAALSWRPAERNSRDGA